MSKYFYQKIIIRWLLGYCICLHFQTPETRGQSPFLEGAGLAGLALSDADFTLSGPHALFGNPAAMVYSERAGVGLFSTNSFLLKELQISGLAAVFPLAGSRFGLAIQHVGFSDFRDMRLQFGYARRLLSNLSIGGSFHVQNRRIAEYGTATGINFSLGLILELTDQLQVVSHWVNPFPNPSGPVNFPGRLSIGLTYQPATAFRLSAAATQRTDGPVEVQLGSYYLAQERLEWMAGINTRTGQLSFGLGYRATRWTGRLAGRVHPQLGFSPGVEVTVEFGDK